MLLTGGFGFDALGTQALNQGELDVVGVEFDLSRSPTNWLSFQAAGVVQNGELDNFNTPAGAMFNGNNVARTPDEQARLTAVGFASDRFSVLTDYHWLGERFGASDNIVEFEACGNLGLGASYAATEQLTL